MNIQCPHCSTGLEIPQEYYGKTVDCPNCSGAIVIKPAIVVQSPSPQANNKKALELEILKGGHAMRYFIPGMLISFVVAISISSGFYLSNPELGFSLGIIFIAICIGRAVIKKISHKYRATTRRIIVTNGIIIHNVDEIRICDIRSISIRRNIINLLTGTASLHIGTSATAGHEILITNISSAKNLQSKLNSLIHEMES
ncbi:PH domain-containing protein [Lentisphaerota bacterium ZTH]|nr:PH domain-containing protein [Lentisphaerota bacterium]WET05534.1 PH domain-containing protein [Lentisphaerota bacterium ZTH]